MTDFSKRDRFRVTTKAALYSPDGRSIVVTKIMNPGTHHGYGLPGGHLDAGETPSQAIIRELSEELGVTVSQLTSKDFFMHPNGKLVLGYVGTLSHTGAFISQEPNKERGEWVSKTDFERISISTVYRQFALDNWPPHNR